jgi:hypothetical protein
VGSEWPDKSSTVVRGHGRTPARSFSSGFQGELVQRYSLHPGALCALVLLHSRTAAGRHLRKTATSNEFCSDGESQEFVSQEVERFPGSIQQSGPVGIGVHSALPALLGQEAPRILSYAELYVGRDVPPDPDDVVAAKLQLRVSQKYGASLLLLLHT